MKRLIRFSTLLLVSLGLACSGSGSDGSSSSLSIELAPLAQVSPSDIVSIRLTVSDSGGVQVATDTQPFALGASTIFELVIEPGTGYRFVAEALDATGTAIYRGSDTADVGADGVVNLTIVLVALEPELACADADGDGYGDPGDASCSAGPQRDCSPTNPAVNPGATEACNDIDDDCDGQVDEQGVCELDCSDGDGDGFGRPGSPDCPGGALPDCNDDDASVFPRAEELCNEVDDDCDGRIDEGFDGDSDGFTTCRGDCNDFENGIFPGAPEICNELDDDCDGGIDEDDVCLEPCDDVDGDGFGTSGGPECSAGPQVDCDDTDAAINPDATEVCDGVDNNCVSGIDEGFDADTDNFTSCGGDCNDGDASINPDAKEICDGVDQNCDLVIDGDGAIGPNLFVDAGNTSGFEVGSAECGYDTIQEGVDAIANGNTLNVASGSYGEFSISGRSNVTVSGANPPPVVTGDGTTAIVVDGGSSGIALSNLEVRISAGQFSGSNLEVVGSGATLSSLNVIAPATGVSAQSGANVTIQSSTLAQALLPRQAEAPRERGAERGAVSAGVKAGASTVTVTSTTITNHASGLDCDSSASCTVNGSSLIQSSDSEGVFCRSGATCSVGGSTTIQNPAGDGMNCLSSSQCTLGSGASATGAGFSGVYCENTSSCTVNGTVTGSGEIGVYCVAACTLDGAVVTGNTSAAVLTENNFSILNSTIGDTVADIDFVRDGLFADLGAPALTGIIQGNTIRNNDNGIECFEGGRGTPSITCTGNTFTGNTSNIGGGCFSVSCTP